MPPLTSVLSAADRQSLLSAGPSRFPSTISPADAASLLAHQAKDVGLGGWDLSDDERNQLGGVIAAAAPALTAAAAAHNAQISAGAPTGRFPSTISPDDATSVLAHSGSDFGQWALTDAERNQLQGAAARAPNVSVLPTPAPTARANTGFDPAMMAQAPPQSALGTGTMMPDMAAKLVAHKNSAPSAGAPPFDPSAEARTLQSGGAWNAGNTPLPDNAAKILIQQGADPRSVAMEQARRQIQANRLSPDDNAKLLAAGAPAAAADKAKIQKALDNRNAVAGAFGGAPFSGMQDWNDAAGRQLGEASAALDAANHGRGNLTPAQAAVAAVDAEKRLGIAPNVEFGGNFGTPSAGAPVNPNSPAVPAWMAAMGQHLDPRPIAQQPMQNIAPATKMVGNQSGVSEAPATPIMQQGPFVAGGPPSETRQRTLSEADSRKLVMDKAQRQSLAREGFSPGEAMNAQMVQKLLASMPGQQANGPAPQNAVAPWALRLLDPGAAHDMDTRDIGMANADARKGEIEVDRHRADVQEEALWNEHFRQYASQFPAGSDTGQLLHDYAGIEPMPPSMLRRFQGAGQSGGAGAQNVPDQPMLGSAASVANQLIRNIDPAAQEAIKTGTAQKIHDAILPALDAVAGTPIEADVVRRIASKYPAVFNNTMWPELERAADQRHFAFGRLWRNPSTDALSKVNTARMKRIESFIPNLVQRPDTAVEGK